MRLLLAFILAAISLSAWADPPSRPLRSFDAAKVAARDAIYADRSSDIYCGCAFEPKGRSGGVMDWTACGYQPRANAARGQRLEWEHVMPAFFFGKDRQCWAVGHPRCERKGRECCARVDEAFRRAEADLHNLAPSVGELNGDRSNASSASRAYWSRNLPYSLQGRRLAMPRIAGVVSGCRRRQGPAADMRGLAAALQLLRAGSPTLRAADPTTSAVGLPCFTPCWSG